MTNDTNHPTPHSLFRKKPVVVEAMLYTADNCRAIHAWAGLGEHGESSRGPGYYCGTTPLYIETLEGTMQADPGDWIIKGVKGEFYPCKPDIFAATYEPADKVVSERLPNAAPQEKAAIPAGQEPLEQRAGPAVAAPSEQFDKQESGYKAISIWGCVVIHGPDGKAVDWDAVLAMLNEAPSARGESDLLPPAFMTPTSEMLNAGGRELRSHFYDSRLSTRFSLEEIALRVFDAMRDAAPSYVNSPAPKP